jgi:hypothetical protein
MIAMKGLDKRYFNSFKTIGQDLSTFHRELRFNAYYLPYNLLKVPCLKLMKRITFVSRTFHRLSP